MDNSLIFYYYSPMGKHWPHAFKVRGLWPTGTRLTDLPKLWDEPEKGLLRQKWFKSYVRKVKGCEEWMGARMPPPGLPYGSTSIGGRNFSAHRVAYTLHYGEDPNGLQVCHSCDNPPCTKKAHLFLGTHTDNVRDMIAKGRHNPARGTRSGTARLTDEDVLKMRELFADGLTDRQLAFQFGVGRMTAKYAITGTTWAHLPNAQPLRGTVSGIRHYSAKLDEKKVREIRKLSGEGWGYNRLGKRFGVDRTTIRSIVKGSAWKDVS